MGDPKRYEWDRLTFQPEDIPASFPLRDQFIVITDVFHERGGPFQRNISWAGIRYGLVVEPSAKYNDCLENAFLEKIYQAFEGNNGDGWRSRMRSVLNNCMTDFWHYLEKDYLERREKGTLMKPIGFLDYDRTEVHRLQLKTIDGTVHAIASETEDDNAFQPLENKFPALRCFPVSEIEFVKRITFVVFRVKIHGQEYCVKGGCRYFVSSLEKLQKAPKIANILYLTGLAVNKDGKVVGMITPFISGIELDCIPSATALQKIRWKEQISAAVKCLHKNGIVWGDAKPNNIIVNNVTGKAVLIDFDGGYSYGWVDKELRDTKEGDLQGLERICRFVDNDIPTCGA